MITVNESLSHAITDTPQLNQYWVLVYSKDDTLLKTITPKEIFSNSKINKSCSSNSSLEVGGCYAGELSLSIVAEAYRENPIVFNRYNKLRVRQYFWYEGIDNEDYRKTSEGKDSTENFVELGTYHINTVTSNDYKADIQAYDLMYALDEKLTDSDNDNLRGTKRTPTELLTWVCNKARKNGYNPTVNILSTINNNLKLKLSEDSTYDTIRELVSDVAFVLGGFAVIGYNNDEIKIMGYSKTTKQLGISHKNILHYSVDIEQSKVGKFMGTCCGFTYEYTATGNVDTYTEESKLLRGIMPYDSKQLSSEVITAYDNIRSDYINKVFVGCEHEITSYPIVELGDNVSITRVYVRNNVETSATVSNILVTEVEHSFNSRTTIVSPSIDHTVVADNYKVSSSPKTSSGGGGGGDEPEFDKFIEGITGVHYREIEVLSPITVSITEYPRASTIKSTKPSELVSIYGKHILPGNGVYGYNVSSSQSYRFDLNADCTTLKEALEDENTELIDSVVDLSNLKFILDKSSEDETGSTYETWIYTKKPFDTDIYTKNVLDLYVNDTQSTSFHIWDELKLGTDDASCSFIITTDDDVHRPYPTFYQYSHNSCKTSPLQATHAILANIITDLDVFKSPINLANYNVGRLTFENYVISKPQNVPLATKTLLIKAAYEVDDFISELITTRYNFKTESYETDTFTQNQLEPNTATSAMTGIGYKYYNRASTTGYTGNPMFVKSTLRRRYEYDSDVDSAIDLINNSIENSQKIEYLINDLNNLKTTVRSIEDNLTDTISDVTALRSSISENSGRISYLTTQIEQGEENVQRVETNLANNVENTRVNADNIATILADYLTSLDLNTVTRRIQAIEDYIGMVDLEIDLTNVYFNSESSEILHNAKYKSEELNMVFVNAYYYNKLKFVWDSNKDGTLFTLANKPRGTGTEYAVTAYKDITSKETAFDVSFGGDSSSYCYSNSGYYKQYYIKGTYGSQSAVSEPINIALVPKITRNSFTATRSGDVVTATLSLSGGFPDLKSLVPNGIPLNPECKYKCKYSLSTSSSTSSTKYKVLDEDYVWDKLTFQFSFEENKPSSSATSYYLHVSYGDGMIAYSASVQVK